MPNFKAISYALALDEHRNFTAAALDLGISQSALSRAIQKLEKDLQVPLFDRGRPDVKPTPLGRAYLERAAHILRELQEAEQEVRMMSGLEKGILRAGFGPLYATSLAGPAVGAFVADNPAIEVRVNTGPWTVLSQMLLAGAIELYVGELSVLEEYDHLKVIPLRTQSGIFFCRPDHPLLARAPVEVADLAEYPLATGRMPPRVVGFLGDLLSLEKSPHGLQVARPAIECEDAGVIKRVVADTLAIGLSPGYVLRAELAAGTLRELAVKGNRLSSQGGVVVRDGVTLSPSAQVFISCLLDADRRFAKAESLFQDK